MPTSSTTWRATGRWLPTACLLLTLAVAGALRTYRLPELPVGLHYDEAANGTLAREIAAGSSRPIFIAAYTGKEVLFFYWTALWMRILDATPAALRLSSALVGIATVAAAVWSTDELLGEPNRPWIGLLTAALLAVSFWHLVLSRYGFRAVTQPLLQALTVGALWHGLGPSRRSTLWLILAGLCCGLTGYTYLAARAFPLPLAAALLTVITADQAHRRQRIGQAAIFVLSALLTLAPLAHYWTAHPDTFLNRASQIAAGSWSEVWQGITACAAMLFIRGDPYIRFNLPLRPLFGPALAICFGIGLIIIVHQLIARLPAARGTTTGGIARESTPKTRAAQVFLLTCLPVMLLPSALATGEITPSNLRTVGLIPFVFVFPAVGLHRLFTHVFNQYVARRIPMKPACALALLVVATLALGTPTTVVAYFRDWAVSPALYDAANGDIVDVARYLNRMDAGTQASTRYVASEHYRHPTLAFLVQDYDAVRSLTGGRTVVLPAGGSGELIYPRSVYDAAGYESLAWVRSALSPIALETTIQGPDGLPAFAAFRVSADTDIVPTHSLQASFAHTVQTLGYDIIGLGENGATVDVAVLWSVLNQPTPGDYGLIARLVDVWGSVWGETVPFHYPAEQWTAGERIYDRLSIPVDAGAPSGGVSHPSLRKTVALPAACTHPADGRAYRVARRPHEDGRRHRTTTRGSPCPRATRSARDG